MYNHTIEIENIAQHIDWDESIQAAERFYFGCLILFHINTYFM